MSNKMRVLICTLLGVLVTLAMLKGDWAYLRGMAMGATTIFVLMQ